MPSFCSKYTQISLEYENKNAHLYIIYRNVGFLGKPSNKKLYTQTLSHSLRKPYGVRHLENTHPPTCCDRALQSGIGLRIRSRFTQTCQLPVPTLLI